MPIKLNINQKDRVINQGELAEFLGVTRVTVWKLEKSGDIPKRKKIPGTRGGWLLSDIIEWIRDREDLSISDEG